jgi:hypothetical protein
VTSSLAKRIAALEARLNGTGDGGRPAFMITIVDGCLPGPIKVATAGEHRWERQEGETEEGFAERAATEAKALGELSLVVGGLTGMDGIAAKYSSFDEFWEAECAAYYDEVPPVSSPGVVSGKGGGL